MFFSHSSRDQKVLNRLKELFYIKTGNAIDVFLSSDGQSIPLGRNWVHRVQEALENASIMLIFLTPNSILSNWVYFEAGFSYSKGIRVVPIGFLGIDLGVLNPPLSLLQGFNINSKDGLDNIIAIANDAFSHKHANGFTVQEYEELISKSVFPTSNALGEYAGFIEKIEISVSYKEGLVCETPEALKLFKDYFYSNLIEFKPHINGVHSYGLSITLSENKSPKTLDIDIDPLLTLTTIPMTENLLRTVMKEGVKGIPIKIDLSPNIMGLDNIRKITARILNTDLKMGVGNTLESNDFTFHIGQQAQITNLHGGIISRESSYIKFITKKDSIPINGIKDIIDLLFERGILEIRRITNGYLE
jgi:hypothetical protein